MEHLNYQEQMSKFISRGMKSNNFEKDSKKLESISYYKLKETAQVFAKTTKIDGELEIDYQGIYFDEVLKRFYQDKNLRLHLLHAIEEIEISIKTKIAYILGRDTYSAYGYLDFPSWCNRENFKRFELAMEESTFKIKLLKKVKNSNSSELQIKLKENIFPPIWLAVNLLTLGEIIHLLKYMSNKNLKLLANEYGMTPNDFLAKIRCIHLVRNICAHNSSVVDFKIKTMPPVMDRIEEYLFHFSDGKITNRVIVPVSIVIEFMKIINPNYKLSSIKKTIKSLCQNEFKSKQFGFKDRESCELYLKTV
ncbi:hypothetical protein CJ191_01070 [Aerococcus viridans]|uniref:Abortive infection bacteriophage resistance protein n=1 Tax=Aerococcus viridans TaxID=1377 RepID=A0A2N6UFR2_9LACT|nr:Abi family protein [Aerococcus viridans]PMC80428.1 hypothetical protein CJ191_01070 [Aerococcus viridans]